MKRLKRTLPEINDSTIDFNLLSQVKGGIVWPYDLFANPAIQAYDDIPPPK